MCEVQNRSSKCGLQEYGGFEAAPMDKGFQGAGPLAGSKG